MSLSAHQLSVGYHGHTIVKEMDLTLPDGRFIALLGPNGCGKSTLLKCFARILPAMSGEARWQGHNLHDYPSKQLSKELALLPQTQPIPEGIKVKDLVAYGRSPYTGFWGKLSQQDHQIVELMMQQTGTYELREQLVSELSGGQRQRVWLAMVLAQDTPYLLLDEPTTYMDINHQVELMHQLQKLNKQGKTIITVLHDINQAARYCDHLVVMKAGELKYQGSPAEVLTSTMLKEVFSLNAQIHSDPVSNTPMCVVEG
ncbi:putative siderophore transport system ATP-binding protein YusV [Marinomonas aquimarina]|uniref:Putative siderophore transport system ATP-binding protein YusV n=1 Tax=Marinomonas aquimarina TaxID=295068 RepID=A0A1A8T125_9GAMM|nr:Fe(3+) dicitrate ABC transporter ATP-binding protein FecE [Marinomonas aquimarina]SBS25624.1 putative siderophore transport system ATP-binding protein YusV [Marinomonas aquimarina]